MKMKYLRTMVRFRNYSRTKRGERVIVRTLSIMSAVLILDVSLLIVGSIL